MPPSNRSTCETVNRKLLYVPGDADIHQKSEILSRSYAIPFFTSTRHAKLNNQLKPISTIGLNPRSSRDCNIHLRLNVTEIAFPESEESRSMSKTECYLKTWSPTEIKDFLIFFSFKTGNPIQSGQDGQRGSS
jgi:hypothetical protein